MLSGAFMLWATPVFGLALNIAPPEEVELQPTSDPSAIVATPAAVDEELTEKEQDQEEYVSSLKTRAKFAKVHRLLGIATFASMSLAVILGTIQYANLYGAFAGQDSNPCVQGDALFGQGQCTGLPWPHALVSGLTAGLYYTTFGLSVLMPDPDKASEGDSKFSENLRTHKWLRWVHFAGMATQILLGVMIANGTSIGLDRANNYGALQALSTVHLGVGLVTLGALGWSGWLML